MLDGLGRWKMGSGICFLVSPLLSLIKLYAGRQSRGVSDVKSKAWALHHLLRPLIAASVIDLAASFI